MATVEVGMAAPRRRETTPISANNTETNVLSVHHALLLLVDRGQMTKTAAASLLAEEPAAS